MAEYADACNRLVRNAIRQVLGLPDGYVRPAWQRLPSGKTTEPYATVNIISDTLESVNVIRENDPLVANQLLETIEPESKFMASVNFWRGPACDTSGVPRPVASNPALSLAAKLVRDLHSSAAEMLLAGYGLGYVEASVARDLTNTIDGHIEARAQVDLTFYVSDPHQVALAAIAEVQVVGIKFQGPDGQLYEIGDDDMANPILVNLAARAPQLLALADDATALGALADDATALGNLADDVQRLGEIADAKDHIIQVLDTTVAAEEFGMVGFTSGAAAATAADCSQQMANAITTIASRGGGTLLFKKLGYRVEADQDAVAGVSIRGVPSGGGDVNQTTATPGPNQVFNSPTSPITPNRTVFYRTGRPPQFTLRGQQSFEGITLDCTADVGASDGVAILATDAIGLILRDVTVRHAYKALRVVNEQNGNGLLNAGNAYNFCAHKSTYCAIHLEDINGFNFFGGEVFDRGGSSYPLYVNARASSYYTNRGQPSGCANNASLKFLGMMFLGGRGCYFEGSGEGFTVDDVQFTNSVIDEMIGGGVYGRGLWLKDYVRNFSFTGGWIGSCNTGVRCEGHLQAVRISTPIFNSIYPGVILDGPNMRGVKLHGCDIYRNNRTNTGMSEVDCSNDVQGISITDCDIHAEDFWSGNPAGTSPHAINIPLGGTADRFRIQNNNLWGMDMVYPATAHSVVDGNGT